MSTTEPNAVREYNREVYRTKRYTLHTREVMQTSHKCGRRVAINIGSTAGGLHENSMHECLSGGQGTLEVFQGLNSARMNMKASTNILPGMLGGLKSARDSNRYLFTFQATIADDHTSPEAGIKKVWAELLPEVRTRRVWHYVVVTKTKAQAETYRVRFSTLLKSFTLGSGTSVQVCGGVLHSSR